MNQDAQQRIMGYFIEEARDHLTTIEQGLLSLRESMSDPELINELFRAAHSIKGGSAMLGLSAIQRTAHRMEDFFNIFRSQQGRVPVDQHLETLLLRGFDTLSMLLEELQSPRGLTEEISTAAMAELEPVFAETESHIYHLMSEREVGSSRPAQPEIETVQTVMSQRVPPLMKEMLELFKRRDQPGIREQLAEKADQVLEVGTRHQLPQWQELATAVRAAIVAPHTDLRNVALVALRDLKQAQQAALQGKANAIQISAELRALAQAPPATAAPAAAPAPAPAMTDAQRRILGFFLEEAREHLTTIEQGLLNLRANSSDPDVIEELFRATHSIKGGAAQLGMPSMQRTAHRMEDFFSIFREHPGQVPVDQHLESLLLQGYDTLSKLMDQLQELGYLPEDYGEATWSEIEPVFNQTEAHIQTLMQGGAPVAPPVPAGPTPLEIVLNQEMPRVLKQMLAHFKQADQAQAQAQLLQDAETLQGYGDTHGLSHWSQLLQTIHTLLRQPDQDLKALALPVLKDLKQAHHALLAGQESSIQASAELLAFLPMEEPEPEAVDAATELDQWLSATEEEAWVSSEQPTQELPLFETAADSPFPEDSFSLEESFTAAGTGDPTEDLSALFSTLSEPDQGLGADLADHSDHSDQGLGDDFELPDLGGLEESSISYEETTEIVLNQDSGPSQELEEDVDLGWVEPPTAEDFDPMPLELGDEDEMAFSDLFSKAEELAAIDDPSFDAPTGFPTPEETAEVSLSQRIGEAKADGDLADLFSEVAETSEGDGWDSAAAAAEPSLDEAAVWAQDELNSDWGSLFEDLAVGDGDLGLAEGTDSDSDPFELNSLAPETGEDDSALFDALFGEEDWDAEAAPAEDLTGSADATPAVSPPVQVPDASTPSPGEDAGLSFEDLFGDPEMPGSEPAVMADPVPEPTPDSMAWDQPIAGFEQGLEEPTLSTETHDLEMASFDELFGLDGAMADTPSGESEGSLTPGSESEELDLAGFDDLFSGSADLETADGWEMESEAAAQAGIESELEDMAAWFSSDSGDTILEDEPGTESGDTVLEDDDSFAFLFNTEEIGEEASPASGMTAEYPVPALTEDVTPDTVLEDQPSSVEADLSLEGLFDSELDSELGSELGSDLDLGDLPETGTPEVEAQGSDPGEISFDRLDALFGDEPEDESLALDATPGAFSVVDADGDGQIDLDELSQFLQEDSPQSFETPPSPEPETGDLDLELDSLFGDDFGDDFGATADEPAQPPMEEPLPSLEAGSPSEDLDDLDDLAALFDEGPEDEPAPTPVSPAPAAAQPISVATPAADGFEDELDALLDDISFDLETPTQAAVPTTAAAPAPPRQTPAPAKAPPPVTQPPAAQPVTARTSQSTTRRQGFSNQTMRVEVRHLDQINNLVGELVVNRNSMEQNQGRLRQFLDGLLVRVQHLSELGQRMQDQYDRSLLETALLASRGEANLASAIVSGVRGSGHSSGQSFDALEMDRFTTFHALSQEIIELIVRVRESSSDIQFGIDEAEQITRQFRQVTTQLQEGLNRARMVPFSQIADRLPRAIRDLSIKTGKQAALVVDGRETSIDKAILEELYDPMTHLVNNALVHGIESPDERRRSSKPAEGRISIKAFYQGNQSIIVVSDDGGGINVEKVRQKALGLGLLAPDADEDEVFNVLFHPGFSGRSAEEVDDLAGRGVGLDVVRRNINELRGSIQIDSERNRGTTFTIRLPLTLSISKAMVCVSDKALVAFPLDGVEEMLDVPQDEIAMDDQGRPTIPWRDTRLHYQPLSDLLRYSRLHNRSRTEVYSITQDEGIVPIVVLQSAGQFVALQVDSFVEEQEIVIKQLRGPAAKPPGIAGATVLGNGRVLPIADIIELVDLAQGRTRRDMSRLWVDRDEDTPEVEAEHQTTVLIVDDSITVRELLSMTFNKVGYRVEQARDGQDAWEKLRGGLPCDLIFCDIEMPRMDGLELLSRLKEDEALQSMPIAMLTSRGAERHRQTARELGATAYFTKPYLEEELLNAAGRMLQGERLMVKE